MTLLGDADLVAHLANHPHGGAPVIQALQALRIFPNIFSEDPQPLGESSRLSFLEVPRGLIEYGANYKRLSEFRPGSCTGFARLVVARMQHACTRAAHGFPRSAA